MWIAHILHLRFDPGRSVDILYVFPSASTPGAVFPKSPFSIGRFEMIKTFAMASAVALGCASVAQAGFNYSATYGWEDGGLSLGGYNNSNLSIFSNTDSEFVYAGNRSLGLTEDPTSGTPQTYVAFITGLTDGDVIDVSLWGWDDTEGASPSTRLWGGYASSDDINNYLGSASNGGGDYSTGTPDNPWGQMSASWTFDSNDGQRDALVIQVRFYAQNSGTADLNTLYVDDLAVNVSSSSDSVVINPPVPAPGALALLGLAGLAGRRRRN